MNNEHVQQIIYFNYFKILLYVEIQKGKPQLHDGKSF